MKKHNLSYQIMIALDLRLFKKTIKSLLSYFFTSLNGCLYKLSYWKYMYSNLVALPLGPILKSRCIFCGTPDYASTSFGINPYNVRQFRNNNIFLFFGIYLSLIGKN